jgi:ATP-binding cassette subfamily C (CFTR/MRP) protein 1
MQLTSLLQRVVFVAIETETHMTSAERIFHYLSIDQEPPEHVPDVDSALGDTWPLSGAVEFRNVVMRYRSNEPVLRDVTLSVRGGHRVGVCGRTGAGKSSLFVALFRLNPVESGTICIDGVDTTTIGLDKLRNAIGVIPQARVTHRLLTTRFSSCLSLLFHSIFLHSFGVSCRSLHGIVVIQQDEKLLALFRTLV